MSNIGTILQGIIAAVKSDAEAKALPLLAAFFSSVAGNPTALNVVAQLSVLNVGLIALGPALGQEILTDISSALNAEIAALVAAQGKP